MDVKRTPDARFERLDGYLFSPHYAEVKAEDGTLLRVHYLDEGPRRAAPIGLMHGNPSWSYLYRKILPRARDARAPRPRAGPRGPRPLRQARGENRLLARSPRGLDEPVARRRLGVENATLFAQDWGGVIGFPVATRHPERFARLIAANTGLPTGPGANRRSSTGSTTATARPRLPVSQLIKSWVVNGLSEASSAPTTRPSPIPATRPPPSPSRA